jgi:hypothetical protein
LVKFDLFFTGVNFTNILSSKEEQLLYKLFLMHFMATAFCKNVPKYGAQFQSCGLKYALKFQQKCWGKQKIIFRTNYFKQAPSHIAQTGW